MKKTIFFIGTACIMSFVLSACHTSKVTKNNSEKISQATPQILNGDWDIVKVNNESVKGGEPASLTFNLTEKRISGNNTCNSFGGNLNFDANKPSEISFGHMISTMRFCADAQSEGAIMKALNETKSFVVVPSEDNQVQIALCDSKDKKVLILQKKESPALDGEWTVKTINDASITGEHTPTMTIDLKNLKLHGYAGCNRMNGQIVTNPADKNAITFERIATTRMACPDSNTENIFLTALNEITNYKILSGTEVALCNKDGKQVIILTKEK